MRTHLCCFSWLNFNADEIQVFFIKRLVFLPVLSFFPPPPLFTVLYFLVFILVDHPASTFLQKVSTKFRQPRTTMPYLSQLLLFILLLFFFAGVIDAICAVGLWSSLAIFLFKVSIILFAA